MKAANSNNGNGNGKAKPARGNCRYCGKFTGKRRRIDKRDGGKVWKVYCNSICRGLHYRGRSRDDRSSPSRKEYIQIRHADGSREYWHRYVYRMENGDIPEGFVVHHKNERKRHNNADNLGALPRNEHTPNAHFHWRTRDWQSPDEYVPLDPDNDPFDGMPF